MIDEALKGEMFGLHLTTQLVPTRGKGEVVILDNLSSSTSLGAVRASHAIGAWFVFLQPYRREQRPIQFAFTKLMASLRKAASGTYDQLWKAVGHVCDLFTDEECHNYFQT